MVLLLACPYIFCSLQKLTLFRQDSLYAAMMAEPPHYKLPLDFLQCGSTQGYHTSIAPNFDIPHQLYGQLAAVFHDIRYLTFVYTCPSESYTKVDFLLFSKLRAATENRLLCLKSQKRASEMTNLDHHLEICRLAALIYIQRALLGFLPPYAVTCSMKLQLMRAFTAKEEKPVLEEESLQPNILIWALFMGGILSTNQEEEYWFAQRIAQGMRATCIPTWAHMVGRLEQVCWMDRLYTPVCKKLWTRIGNIMEEY